MNKKINDTLDDKVFYGHKLASKSKRLLGYLCDLIIQLIIIFGLQYLLFKTSFDEFLNKEIDLYSVAVNCLISFCFGSLTYPFFSGNIGHLILGLKVIDSKSGKDYRSVFEGGGRELLKNILSYLVLPIIWLIFDKKRQNLYDKLTNTYVVNRRTIANNV